MEAEKNARGFSSKFGFLMATAGSAIGLGNLWSFPYKTGQGGGAAFVLMYLIMVLLIGIVALVAEFFIGKRAQSNVVDSYGKMHGRCKWLGWLAVLTPFVILTYYAVIGGWSVRYAVDYIGGIGAAASSDLAGEFGAFISSSGMPILYLSVFMIFVMGIVLGGVKKGIERAGKILMPLLFVCLIVIVIKGLTLSGAKEGLLYLFKPDFSKLSAEVVLSAMGQVFFSLSLGMGINIAYGSYMRKDMDIGKSAAAVCVLDSTMALLAGIAIFPAVFSFDIEPSAGPGLLFSSMTYVFNHMAGGRIFGAVFFCLVILAAVTSSIALLEVPVQYLVEKFGWPRKILTLVLGLIVMAIGALISLSFGAKGLQIGNSSLLDIFDTATNKILLPTVASATCIVLGWYIKPKTVIEELQIKTRGKLWIYRVWGILLQFVTPTAIMAILAMGFVEIFTSDSSAFGAAAQWTSIAIALSAIAGCIAANILIDRKNTKKTPPRTGAAEEI